MADPVYPNLPRTQTALVNKYNTLAPQLSSLPPSLRNALFQLDQQRTKRGQNPISVQETSQVLRTALTGEPATPPKERSASVNPLNILGNAVGDLRNIVGSIPRIPVALLNEGQELANIGEHLSKADSVSDYLQLPGIRMVPGTYTLSNILSGNVGEITRHPLFTGLDVLPVAKSPIGRPVTKAIGQSAPGQFTKTQYTNLKNRTNIGQAIQGGFGQDNRQLSRIVESKDFKLRQLVDPREKARRAPDPDSDVEFIAQEGRELVDKYVKEGVTYERQNELGALAEINLNDPRLANLTDAESAYLNEYKTLSNEFGMVKVHEDYLGLREGELFDQYDLKTLRRREDVFSRRTAPEKIEAIRKRLSKNIAQDPKFQPVLDAVDAGDWQGAKKLLQNAKKRKSVPGNLTTTYNDIYKIAASEQRLANFKRTMMPARFMSYAQQKAREKYLAKVVDDPDFENIEQYVKDGFYSLAGEGAAKEIADIAKEIGGGWRELKEAGVDPLFIHRVAPEAIRSLDNPRITEVPRNPSFTKKRVWDWTPYQTNPAVALTHEALELLAKRGSEESVKEISATFGRKKVDIQRELHPEAKRLEARTGRPAAEIAQRLLQKQYREFTYWDFLPWSKPKISGLDADAIFIPKHVFNGFKLIFEPPQSVTQFTRALDPITGLFRTSVLPLSIRWHVNNIAGGSIQTLIESPTAFRWWGKARKMLNDHEIPESIERGSFSRFRKSEIKEWDDNLKGIVEHNIRAGTTLRRLLDMGGRVIDKSYALNGWFDDTFRAMMYLQGKHKAVKSGLSKEAAEQAGVALSRKVFQAWDDMTPLERMIMRSVFPFYGFASHILRYVMKYPADHPLRVAIMGSFTRNELEDRKHIPDSFLSTFFIGDVDNEGRIKGINTGAFNPFRQTADYFTLAGFTSSLNPVAATILEAMGVDTTRGMPELYPTLEYDSETGRLRSKGPGIVETLLGNTIPQSSIVMALLDRSAEFKDLMSRDPDAAKRFLQAGAGLPIIYRGDGVPIIGSGDVKFVEEQYKAELARDEEADQVKAKALKSGDYDAAKKFPSLRAYFNQIEEINRTNPSALTPYNPSSEQVIQSQEELKQKLGA